MPVNLSGRNFLKLLDFTTAEIEYSAKKFNPITINEVFDC